MIKFPQDRGQQGLIAHGQHAPIASGPERLALPIGDGPARACGGFFCDRPQPNAGPPTLTRLAASSPLQAEWMSGKGEVVRLVD